MYIAVADDDLCVAGPCTPGWPIFNMITFSCTRGWLNNEQPYVASDDDASCRVGSIVGPQVLPLSPIPLSGHISGFWAAHWNWKELLRTQLDCARHRGGWSRQGGSGRRKVANPHLLHFIYFVFTFAMNKLMFHGCERSLQFFCLRFVNGILRNCCKID